MPIRLSTFSYLAADCLEGGLRLLAGFTLVSLLVITGLASLELMATMASLIVAGRMIQLGWETL